MPTYEFLCPDCGVTKDEIFRIAERPESIPCDCGGRAEFIISAPQIKCDDVVNIPWLQDFAKKRPEARFGKKPIQTRQEYHQYLKDHNLRDPHRGENLTEI